MLLCKFKQNHILIDCMFSLNAYVCIGFRFKVVSSFVCFYYYYVLYCCLDWQSLSLRSTITHISNLNTSNDRLCRLDVFILSHYWVKCKQRTKRKHKQSSCIRKWVIFLVCVNYEFIFDCFTGSRELQLYWWESSVGWLCLLHLYSG